MTIREMIQELAKTGDELYSKLCKVDRVDEKRRIFDATPVDGSAPVLEVRLQPVENRTSGLIFVPKVGSFVIVTFFSPEDTYFAMGTEFEKVLLDVGDIHMELLNPEGDEKGKVSLKVGGSAMELTSDDKGYAKLNFGGASVNIGQNEKGKTKVRIDCEKEFKGKDPVPSIIFNEGENGGLVIAKELHSQLSALWDWCQSHTHGYTDTAPNGIIKNGETLKGLSDIHPDIDQKSLQNKHIMH